MPLPTIPSHRPLKTRLSPWSAPAIRWAGYSPSGVSGHPTCRARNSASCSVNCHHAFRPTIHRSRKMKRSSTVSGPSMKATKWRRYARISSAWFSSPMMALPAMVQRWKVKLPNAMQRSICASPNCIRALPTMCSMMRRPMSPTSPRTSSVACQIRSSALMPLRRPSGTVRANMPLPIRGPRWTPS